MPPEEEWQPSALTEHARITALLFPTPGPDLHKRLDAFRREWERLHGPTDLERTYTTQLPRTKQDHMLREAPDAYFAGWPDFAIAFFEGLLKRALRDGWLDAAPDAFLRVFVKNRGRLRPYSNTLD